jgi:hypothetical protein
MPPSLKSLSTSTVSTASRISAFLARTFLSMTGLTISILASLLSIPKVGDSLSGAVREASSALELEVNDFLGLGAKGGFFGVEIVEISVAVEIVEIFSVVLEMGEIFSVELEMGEISSFIGGVETVKIFSVAMEMEEIVFVVVETKEIFWSLLLETAEIFSAGVDVVEILSGAGGGICRMSDDGCETGETFTAAGAVA